MPTLEDSTVELRPYAPSEIEQRMDMLKEKVDAMKDRDYIAVQNPMAFGRKISKKKMKRNRTIENIVKDELTENFVKLKNSSKYIIL